MRKYLLRFLPHIGCGFFFSMFINVLQLSYLMYLRLLFDKVINSHSTATLFYLTAAVIGAYLIMGVLEVIRSKLLVRVGVKFDQVVAKKVFSRMIETASAAGSAKHTQGLKDLNNIRNFFGGTGIFAFFDTPWVPVYIAIIFLFHPLLGIISSLGALALLLLVLAQEFSTARLQARYAQSSMVTDQFLNSTLRNVQSVHAMGMLPALSQQWQGFNSEEVYYENQLSARSGFFQSTAKFIMMSTVILIMSIGTYLVILHEATIGTLVASTMMMSRALSPMLMLGNAWKSLVESRIAYKRLNELLNFKPRKQAKTLEEAPTEYKAENLSYFINGLPVLQNINFRLEKGQILAIIGPSGAGKSTLARILLGVWQPGSGQVQLGDKNIHDLDQNELGRKIGYIPQEVELFSGTIAENIARMNAVDSQAVVNAATLAGTHQMILGLPEGYDTRIGQDGINLSGGQKQRIALARALYQEPWFIVMDEPDSHLDNTGRQALKDLLLRLKELNIAVIIISHNQDLAQIADNTLILDKGQALQKSTGQTCALENNQ